MFWFCAALSAAGVLESVVCSCLVAEFAGYWLHRLLPGDILPFLSRNRMAHRLLPYGPMQPMREESCKHATHDRGFRTLPERHRRLNKERLAIALSRYRLGTPLQPVGGNRTGEREAFE
jgi:hypothetical protein